MFSRYVTSNSLPWFWSLSYDPYHKRLVDDFTNTFAVFRSQMWVKIKLHSHKFYIPTMLIYPPVCCELNRQWLPCHVLGLWWNNFSKCECMFGVIIDITCNINIEPKKYSRYQLKISVVECSVTMVCLYECYCYLFSMLLHCRIGIYYMSVKNTMSASHCGFIENQAH